MVLKYLKNCAFALLQALYDTGLQQKFFPVDNVLMCPTKCINGPLIESVKNTHGSYSVN